jgi:hypothetical protein
MAVVSSAEAERVGISVWACHGVDSDLVEVESLFSVAIAVLLLGEGSHMAVLVVG